MFSLIVSIWNSNPFWNFLFPAMHFCRNDNFVTHRVQVINYYWTCYLQLSAASFVWPVDYRLLVCCDGINCNIRGFYTKWILHYFHPFKILEAIILWWIFLRTTTTIKCEFQSSIVMLLCHSSCLQTKLICLNIRDFRSFNTSYLQVILGLPIPLLPPSTVLRKWMHHVFSFTSYFSVDFKESTGYAFLLEGSQNICFWTR